MCSMTSRARTAISSFCLFARSSSRDSIHDFMVMLWSSYSSSICCSWLRISKRAFQLLMGLCEVSKAFCQLVSFVVMCCLRPEVSASRVSMM